MSRFNKSILLVLLILIIDQIIKIWVKTNMELNDTIYIFGKWSQLHFVENKGMAFGLELGGDNGKLFLSLFRVVAIVGIIWYLRSISRKKTSTITLVSISLILAGAVGNIIDSAFYGLIFNSSAGQVAELFPAGGGYGSFLYGDVVDMFYFPMIHGTYPDWFPYMGGDSFIFFRPVFNFADASITCGVILFIIFRKKFIDPSKKNIPEAVLETKQETESISLNKES